MRVHKIKCFWLYFSLFLHLFGVIALVRHFVILLTCLHLNKNKVYHSGFSLSFAQVAFSTTCSLESFFILGCLGGPLSTVGLLCTLVCDSTTCVACADPFIVPYILSSSDVHSCRFTSFLKFRCLTNNHSVLWSSVLSFPPWEHKQRD